ncbi:hypothetical protein SeMB42_g03267 [Synchytrium endobioticum]|uniref:Glutaredoxin domain-containing protein n=1 Tax=Synchytrium endobioticum TaxID=286115 RepID=A0A507D9M3_9FUNG|nr:hypothetical protein SeLEV6574_g04096 [Synchytrium endobioticum]TPX47600.1 hypothetical protein SeMB42_g03267 [Synchytrium endobioticum]
MLNFLFRRSIASSSVTMAAVKDLVEQLIHDNAVQVFSKSYCPYCTKAKSLLDSMNIKYNAVELDLIGEQGQQIQDYLYQKTQQRTVPNIFIREQHVGGCDDLHSAKASGKLESLLKL